jgi:phosphoribosylanthranilate isomerase
VAAASSGADAIGINLLAGPRRVDIEAACEIVRAVPPFCTPVALVRLEHDQLEGDVLELLGRGWVSHLQLYGEITPNGVARLRDDGFVPLLVHYVAPNRFPDDVDAVLAAMEESQPAGIVLDAHDPERLGGTGQPVDWAALAAARAAGRFASWPPVVLAGGLTADNVAQAVRTVQPWGVDVSSGVEHTLGRKDPAKMRAFVANVRAAAI